MKNNQMNQGTPQTQRINVDISQAQDIVCDKCRCPFFMDVMRLKKLSAILSPTGREEMINIQTILCVACGHEYGAPVQGPKQETVK